MVVTNAFGAFCEICKTFIPYNGLWWTPFEVFSVFILQKQLDIQGRHVFISQTLFKKNNKSNLHVTIKV